MGGRGWTVRGGLLLAGNDETDGLLCLFVVPNVRMLPEGAEGETRASRRKLGTGSLKSEDPWWSARHYRYRTKPTFAPADVPRATLLPREHTRYLKSQVWDSFVYDARTLTSLAASEPFTARDGLTATAASRERDGRGTPLLLGFRNGYKRYKRKQKAVNCRNGDYALSHDDF